MRRSESIGAAKPDETEIGIDVAYSTAIFEVPKDPPPWKGLLHLPLPPNSSRGAILLPIENGCWMVARGAAHGDAPAGDIEGYMAFARSLRTPTVYDAIKNAKQAGDIARFKFPSSIRRHFEKLQVFPPGLLPIADAVCRFNPVFGQGMSIAAQEAFASSVSLRNDVGCQIRLTDWPRFSSPRSRVARRALACRRK